MNNCIYFSVNFPPEVGVIVLNECEMRWDCLYRKKQESKMELVEYFFPETLSRSVCWCHCKFVSFDETSYIWFHFIYQTCLTAQLGFFISKHQRQT